MALDFLDQYLQYTIDTEATATFHRWSAIVGIGAWLKKNIWIQHGASKHYPNHYTMLLGESGTRKSSAIKGFLNILRLAGYDTIAADKTSKEKFLADLSGQHTVDANDDSLLWAEADKNSITPILIGADEANDFFGVNNVEFLSILGNLWDYSGVYEAKYKTSKSDFIPNPCVSILAGNTPTNFSVAFPPILIGQGFFSRILLIYGERTRPKIPWPTTPDDRSTAEIVRHLRIIKTHMMGEMLPTPTAKALIAQIYLQPEQEIDQRFASFFQRRLTHLLKLCLVVAACKLEKEITENTVIQANTYLTYIQNLMPRALGEYGKSVDSDTTHKVMNIISDSRVPTTVKMLAKQVINDVKSLSELQSILQKLIAAERITVHNGGYIAVEQEMTLEHSSKFVDYESYLTEEEMKVKTL